MFFSDAPREKESTAWLGVAAWTAFIYLTIPLARAIQETVRERAGKEVFLWITFLAFAAAAAWILRALFRRRWTARPSQLFVLSAVGGLFTCLIWSLRANPEEAFHFVQYGVLSILLFRAFSHRLRDPSACLAAALAGALRPGARPARPALPLAAPASGRPPPPAPDPRSRRHGPRTKVLSGPLDTSTPCSPSPKAPSSGSSTAATTGSKCRPTPPAAGSHSASACPLMSPPPLAGW